MAPMTTQASAAGPSIEEAGGILTVDLAAVVKNWRDLGRRVAPAKCASVVKADGYGCGIEPVAAALAKAGCDIFFVAELAEGRSVRGVAPAATIYVLNGLVAASAPSYVGANLRPVIGSIAELAEWNEFCDAQAWPGGAALHVDTGMNRLGLSPREAADLGSRAASTSGIHLIMSHFACADEPGQALNGRQMGIFADVRRLFAGIPGSLANSSGIFLGPDAHHDLVRPGGALFGSNPTPEHLNPMRAVVRLDARILRVRNIAQGESVGYGATWTARRPSRIAVAAIGYADGVLRACGAADAKPGAEAVVAGRPCPVVGRISMDLLTIDVTDLPEDVPSRGDWATLLDGTLGVDDLASHAGTIGYELLVRLGRRLRRIYTS